MAGIPIKWFIGIFIIVTIVTLIYFNHNSLNFNEVTITNLDKAKQKKKTHPLAKNKVVLTEVLIGIGNGDAVGIELATPYNNKKQLSQLVKYSKIIKNDFLMTVGEREMKKWAKERNYTAVKKTFLNITNKYVDEPVNNLYFNIFFIE